MTIFYVLWKKSIRIKFFGIRPKIWISMNVKCKYVNICFSGNDVFGWKFNWSMKKISWDYTKDCWLSCKSSFTVRLNIGTGGNNLRDSLMHRSRKSSFCNSWGVNFPPFSQNILFTSRLASAWRKLSLSSLYIFTGFLNRRYKPDD